MWNYSHQKPFFSPKCIISARTRWGSLQRSIRLPSWIKGPYTIQHRAVLIIFTLDFQTRSREEEVGSGRCHTSTSFSHSQPLVQINQSINQSKRNQRCNWIGTAVTSELSGILRYSRSVSTLSVQLRLWKYEWLHYSALKADWAGLTLSPPIPLRLYTLPYWSNPPFLISDIRAVWRSGLSARPPECQKLKWWVRPVWRWTFRTAAICNSWRSRG